MVAGEFFLCICRYFTGTWPGVHFVGAAVHVAEASYGMGHPVHQNSLFLLLDLATIVEMFVGITENSFTLLRLQLRVVFSQPFILALRQG